MRTIYGPIDSWRFGRSLGVDPLAGRAKLCPLSCVYCQYGRTERLTLRRQIYVSADQLRSEMERLGDVEADCLTFAGLGEPTLARNLPDLVAVAREHLALPVVLLTGCGLLPREDVHRDLLAFDRVVAKLDAPDERLFEQINRPMSGYPYSLAAIVGGIRRFRQMYGGHLALQMMFIQANAHVAPHMAELARSLQPDEVQLDTPLQPALGGPLSADEMQEVVQAFAGLPVRCIYDAGRARVQPRAM
jgi:wyosine [tRNA(Phe)-imidazoG37] synthetase (radical SAM superfamily)